MRISVRGALLCIRSVRSNGTGMRSILAPLTWPLAALLRLRHALYDAGLLRSTRPAVPTIAIGNLALGGTGKTPMLELVLRTLEDQRPLAPLSRGYGRQGTDIHEVHPGDTADRSGDEPVQVKRNFPAVRVFVGVDRVKAIAAIQELVPGVKAVVLDDALQHRRLDAGLNILLTTARRPYCDDALVPVGTLRDLRARARCAQVVVVTKCPALPTPAEQAVWRERLGLRPHQQLFFAGLAHGAPCLPDGRPLAPPPGREHSALVVTGIARPEPLVAHARSLFGRVEHLRFRDHHAFTAADLARLAGRFDTFAPAPKVLITTEKDAARLRPLLADGPLRDLPVATIGIRTVILNEPERFAELLHRHVGTHPAHR